MSATHCREVSADDGLEESKESESAGPQTGEVWVTQCPQASCGFLGSGAEGPPGLSVMHWGQAYCPQQGTGMERESHTQSPKAAPQVLRYHWGGKIWVLGESRVLCRLVNPSMAALGRVSVGHKAKWQWGCLTAGKWDEPLLHHQCGHGTAALQHGHHLVMRAVPAKERWPRRA